LKLGFTPFLAILSFPFREDRVVHLGIEALSANLALLSEDAAHLNNSPYVAMI